MYIRNQLSNWILQRFQNKDGFGNKFAKMASEQELYMETVAEKWSKYWILAKNDLCRFIQKYRVIYNKFYNDFKNIQFMKNTWTSIGEVFGVRQRGMREKYNSMLGIWTICEKTLKNDIVIQRPVAMPLAMSAIIFRR